jgi:hypothetical protein
MPLSPEIRDGYGPELLAAIDIAYEAVWTTVCMQGLSDAAQSAELKVKLSRTLVALASQGVSDPQELRRLALESMGLTSQVDKRRG